MTVKKKSVFLPLLVIFIVYIINGAYFNTLFAQEVSAYSDIPRIDVHTHVGSDHVAIANYLELRILMQQIHKIDLAMWLNLGVRGKPLADVKDVNEVSQGRILCCIGDYAAHDGLNYAPEELNQCLERGYVGYKIWSGPWYRRLEPDQKGYRYIDDPAHEPTFAEMEKIGMVAASIHIADPNGPWGNRTKWLSDPIEYWKEINAWRNVLEKHPDLSAVAAHGDWLICQDAQIDYLRNMFATYPKLHVDLAATFQYYYMVNRENLRSFMIEWSDRILFGTDIGSWESPEETKNRVEQYFRCFRILETDEMVEGGFFGLNETQGLALPRDVLEKIYYKNAMNIYPNVKESLVELGYTVQSK